MKKIVALVLSLVMVLGLATTAFAVKGGQTFAGATADKGWDYVVEVDDAEDAKDKTFATYEIEAVALFDGAKNYFATGTVEEGDDFDLGTYVKVANAWAADFVLVDGKVVTYFQNAVEVKGWNAPAVKASLPAYPVDNADKACNTLYSPSVSYAATVYVFDDALWVASSAEDATATDLVKEDDVDVIFNVDGVAVYARAAVEGEDYLYTGHAYEIEYKGDHDAENVTKVYCQDCKAEFDFVAGPETAAVAVFGAGNYQPLFDGLWMELVVPANFPGVTSSVVGSTTTTTDTVESAQTFDAGIAMYVGMSVMAAAGSAVVLKKKD